MMGSTTREYGALPPDGRPAPLDGCNCAVCVWARRRAWPNRIKPSDAEWPELLRAAREVRA